MAMNLESEHGMQITRSVGRLTEPLQDIHPTDIETPANHIVIDDSGKVIEINGQGTNIRNRILEKLFPLFIQKGQEGSSWEEIVRVFEEAQAPTEYLSPALFSVIERETALVPHSFIHYDKDGQTRFVLNASVSVQNASLDTEPEAEPIPEKVDDSEKDTTTLELLKEMASLEKQLLADESITFEPVIEPDYLNELGQVTFLGHEEIVLLSARIQTGTLAFHQLKNQGISDDQKERLGEQFKSGALARKKLVISFLPLVIFIAQKYKKEGLPLQDAIKAGNIGLIIAAQRYDHTRGAAFSTFATLWIRQTVSREVDNNAHTIRIPVHMVKFLKDFEVESTILFQKYGRFPTIEELVHELDISVERTQKLRQYWQRKSVLSLDAPFQDSQTDKEADEVNPSKNPIGIAERVADPTAQEEQEEIVYSLLEEDLIRIAQKAGVSLAHARILWLRSEIPDSSEKPWSQAEIACMFGLSRQRIEQIEKNALIKVRTYLQALPKEADNLREYGQPRPPFIKST